MKAIYGMGAVLLMATTVFAQLAAVTAPPETVDGLVQFLGKLIESITSGNYQVAGGIMIMALMVGVRQFGIAKMNLDPKILPYVSAVVAVIAFAGLGMMNGVPFLDAVKSGLVQSLLANGMWDMLGKTLAKMILGDKYQVPPEKDEAQKAA